MILDSVATFEVFVDELAPIDVEIKFAYFLDGFEELESDGIFEDVVDVLCGPFLGGELNLSDDWVGLPVGLGYFLFVRERIVSETHGQVIIIFDNKIQLKLYFILYFKLIVQHERSNFLAFV